MSNGIKVLPAKPKMMVKLVLKSEIDIQRYDGLTDMDKHVKMEENPACPTRVDIDGDTYLIRYDEGGNYYVKVECPGPDPRVGILVRKESEYVGRFRKCFSKSDNGVVSGLLSVIVPEFRYVDSVVIEAKRVAEKFGINARKEEESSNVIQFYIENSSLSLEEAVKKINGAEKELHAIMYL